MIILIMVVLIFACDKLRFHLLFYLKISLSDVAKIKK